MIKNINEIKVIGDVDNFTSGEIKYFMDTYFSNVSNIADFAKGMYAYKQFLEGKKVAMQRRKAKAYNVVDYLSNNKEYFYTRRMFTGCYCDKGFQIATDGQWLLKQKANYSTEYEGKIIDKDNNIIDEQFPNYTRVIPDDSLEMEQSNLFSYESIKSYMSVTKTKSDSKLREIVCKIGSFISELDNKTEIPIVVNLNCIKRVKMFLEAHDEAKCKLYRSHARKNCVTMMLTCEDDTLVFVAMSPDIVDNKAIYVYNAETKLVSLIELKKE